MSSDLTNLLEKAERASVAGAASGARGLSGLPPDIIQEAAKRLGRVCLVYAIGFLIIVPLGAIYDWVTRHAIAPHLQGVSPYISATTVTLSLILYTLTRRAKLAPKTLLDLGLVFQVIGAFGIAMSDMFGSFPPGTENHVIETRYLGIPWECVWITIFPMIAPNSTGKVLVASLASASMGLLAVLISKAAGLTSPDLSMTFFLNHYLFTTYFCAIMATILNRIVIRYGARLKEAREIGQYQMSKLLGKGGMGEVWLARHRMLARPAAIKLIRPEIFGHAEDSVLGHLRRFEREARSTAMLQSPHTIGIYDFGLTKEGVFYYVMELLDGMDLQSLVEHYGPVNPGRAIAYLRQACHSLHEAHEAGMIHRDIKPANIYVCRLGLEHDFVKVLDFGLVKAGPSAEKDSLELTQEGVAFGTPNFMAPEMAVGSVVVDARADIYALGCVAYWLLTGQTVFDGSTPMAMVLEHVKSEPRPPSARTELEVPADLEEVILACLAKDPRARPQDAAELDRLLAECKAAGSWTAAQADEWWSLHRPRRESLQEDPTTPYSLET